MIYGSNKSSNLFYLSLAKRCDILLHMKQSQSHDYITDTNRIL